MYDCVVSPRQTYVSAFQFLKLGLVSLRFLAVGFLLLLYPLAVNLFHIFIVGGFEVLGCYQRRGIEVFTHTLQHLDIVKPHSNVLELVSVALGYLDGVPILVNIRLIGWSCAKVSEQLNGDFSTKRQKNSPALHVYKFEQARLLELV